MKKILFIDRDGTLIWEDPITFQIDSLDKLKLLPGMIANLAKISIELNYELVMVSNQDGLGTPGYPQDSFDIVQSSLLKSLTNAGIKFSDILIDKTFAYENAETRKPRLGMLRKYLSGYDLNNSYVIGDRLTDLELAKNLGSKSIFIRNLENPEDSNIKAELVASNWQEIYSYLKSQA